MHAICPNLEKVIERSCVIVWEDRIRHKIWLLGMSLCSKIMHRYTSLL